MYIIKWRTMKIVINTSKSYLEKIEDKTMGMDELQ